MTHAISASSHGRKYCHFVARGYRMVQFDNILINRDAKRFVRSKFNGEIPTAFAQRLQQIRDGG
jgi:hypothetical protein